MPVIASDELLGSAVSNPKFLQSCEAAFDDAVA
jgi:hypothetical protein